MPALRSSWTIFSISFFWERGDDTDGYWEEGFRVQGECNDREHHVKEGVPREWKIPLDVYKGWLGGLGAPRVSLLLVWHGVGK
jgi:hypothetical protein